MKRSIFLSYLAGALAIFLAWWGISALVALPMIPSPWIVAAKLVNIFAKSIAIHAAYSLWRIAAGLVLAVVVGFPLGMVMGYFPKADRYLAPLVYLTYPVPKIALLPIFMLLAGVGETSKIIMIFLIIVFQVVIAVRDGIRAIPKETYFPLYSLGASFVQVFAEVLWPASLPKFITAVRVAMATAISVLFFTETFGTQYGMGYFIMDAWLRVNYLDMYAGIVCLSFIGLLLFGVIDLVEHFASRWQKR
ncbi:MAG: ABC transporter permease [Selenomonadaceae bacterium]|nr:ABC transporter permease [Selenomonadaceae bacterium]